MLPVDSGSASLVGQLAHTGLASFMDTSKFGGKQSPISHNDQGRAQDPDSLVDDAEMLERCRLDCQH